MHPRATDEAPKAHPQVTPEQSAQMTLRKREMLSYIPYTNRSLKVAMNVSAHAPDHVSLPVRLLRIFHRAFRRGLPHLPQ